MDFLEKPQAEINAGGCCKKADQNSNVNQKGIQEQKW